MKGYLAFRDQPLEGTHDLERLRELAVALEPALAPLETQADVLHPCAAGFRHPEMTPAFCLPHGEHAW